VEADTSDRKLEKLVDDNATAFAALGLGTLPGRDSGKQVQPPADFTSAAACATTSCHNLDALHGRGTLANTRMLA
jgi:hypothetical protein